MESASLALISRRARTSRGFTLVEMLVVLAIITIITAVVLVGQNGFNKSILLTDTAYTMALSIRQAQSFGLSSRTFTNRTTSVSYSNTGYGIHFDAATPSSYIFFADAVPAVGSLVNGALCPAHTITDPNDPEARPGNCMYDGPSYGELLQTYSFSKSFTIQSFCGYVGVGSNATPYCSNSGAPQLQALDIVFERPNTSSVMTGIISNEYSYFPGVVTTNFSTVCIRIAAPNASGNMYVKITQLGQVSVSPSCTP